MNLLRLANQPPLQSGSAASKIWFRLMPEFAAQRQLPPQLLRFSEVRLESMIVPWILECRLSQPKR